MKQLAIKAWKDPVFSKIIAAAIMGSLLYIWSLVDYDTFRLFFLDLYEVPVLLLIAVAVLLICFFFQIRRTKPSKAKVENRSNITAILDSWWPEKPLFDSGDIYVNFKEL